MTHMQAQLDKIRSDAAECLVLSQLAPSEKKEIFAKMAEHLNGLALEIEKRIAADGPDARLVEHRSPECITDPSPAHGQLVVSNTSATAYQATRSHRLIPWLLVIVAALIIGVFFRTNENAKQFLSLLTVQSKQDAPLLPQDGASQVRLLSDDEGERRLVAEQLGALTARVGGFEKAPGNSKRVRVEGDSNGIFNGADKTSIPAIARDDLETKAALLNRASDEGAQFRRTAETTSAALPEEPKETGAPPRREREHADLQVTQAAPVADTTPIASPAAAAPPPQPKRMDSGELAVLVKRAKDFLATGDISAARLLLERAAEKGQDAGAALLLARTYDPAVLGTSDVRNITAEPEEASAWYRKAAELGSAEAQQRLAQLSH